jgi:hypothetical protein
MVVRALLWPFIALLPFTGFALAVQIDDEFYFDETMPVPAAVLALQDCDADARTPAHRKPFAGGYIFLIKCPSDNRNFRETLIFSEHEDGSGAWLLRFPHWPLVGGAIIDTLSNVRWYPKTNAIGDVFVDPESKTPCRFEARWKLEGKLHEPRLVFWRENDDCDGKKPWHVLLNRK